MRRDIFLSGGEYFFFYAAARLFSHPPISLEPRPKFACRSKISQNQNFIFIADRFPISPNSLLLEPLPENALAPAIPLPTKKGAVFRPLLICKLFVNLIQPLQLIEIFSNSLLDIIPRIRSLGVKLLTIQIDI